MPYISIDNFKFGLDSRKSVLSSQPGTLVTAENCHINEGGEVEQRKEFSQYATDTGVDSNGDHGYFGLEASSFGLLTFTHDTTVTVPTGLTKRVLKHPEVYDGGSYSRTKHRITAIVDSRPYQGNVIVFATFSDGNTFGYYCQSADASSVATLINAFRNGMRFASTVLKTDIKRQINAITGWVSADADTAEIGFDQIVSIKSPVNITFDAVVTKTSAGGTMGFSAIPSSANIGVQLLRAYASFTISAVANGATIAVDAFSGVHLGKVLLVVPSDSTTTAATDLALSINKLTGLTGYSAVSSAAVVWVFAPADTNPGVITITSTGGAATAAGSGALSFFVTASVYSVSATGSPGFGLETVISPPVTIYPNGGTSPYTYQWTEVGGPSGISVSSPTLATTTFRMTLDRGDSRSGSFRCTVQDNAGPPKATAFIDIQVTLTHG